MQGRKGWWRLSVHKCPMSVLGSVTPQRTHKLLREEVWGTGEEGHNGISLFLSVFPHEVSPVHVSAE